MTFNKPTDQLHLHVTALFNILFNVFIQKFIKIFQVYFMTKRCFFRNLIDLYYEAKLK